MLWKSHRREIEVTNKTPWQTVFEKFDMSQNALAKACGWDRSKISRALGDKSGVINGRDQIALLKMARSRSVKLTGDDFLPVIK